MEEIMLEGACSLCGLRGKGNKGLFLCSPHINLISQMYCAPLLREQLAQAIKDKRDGDPLTNQQAQAGFLLGLDTALEMVRGQK